ncbi:MAG: polyphosphate kinase 2 family protein, partial [Flavobacterium sp.]|nr:polyphosphate kinase 2 family protein [Flavobacterium sp.]
MSKSNNKKSNDFEENARELGNLSKKELVKKAKNFSKQYCVGNGEGFKLKDYETKASFNLGEEGKPLVKETLQIGVDALAAMQDILYA